MRYAFTLVMSLMYRLKVPKSNQLSESFLSLAILYVEKTIMEIRLSNFYGYYCINVGILNINFTIWVNS